MASENLIVGTAANANDGDTLRAAFIKVKKMFSDIYGQTYEEQGDLAGDDFKIKATQVSSTNSAVDGYVLTYDSTSGGFTFEQKFDGDITSIVAGVGLGGSSLDTDDATLNLDLNELTAAVASVADDSIAIIDASDSNAPRKESISDLVGLVAGGGLTATSGVLSVDSIGTDGIANDAVTAAKIALFDDALAATDTHVLVADGTDFNNVALSGDATISNTGALTIADDAVDYDKLAAEFTTSSALTAATDLSIDFSTAAIFTTTSSIAVELEFTNAEIGQVKTIIVTDSGGASSLTFDATTNTSVTLNGAYSATSGAVNYIQAQCIAANSFILTVSQVAA